MTSYITLVFIVTSLLLSVLLAHLVRATVEWLFWFNQVRRAAKTFPGPPTHWLFGTLHLIKGGFSQALLDWMITLATQYKYAYRIWMGPTIPQFIVCHPETVRIVTNSTEPKALGFAGAYNFVRPWLGDGLLLSSGPKWFRNRKLLTPGFHFDVLKPYIDVYNKAAGIMLDQLGEACSAGKSVDITPYVSLCTLDIILKCALTSDRNIQKQTDKDPYVVAVYGLCRLLAKRTLQPLMFWDRIYYLTPSGREYQRHIDYVHTFSSDLISKRRQNLEETEHLPRNRYVDFLDILLLAKDENGKGLTHNEIRDEVDTFLFEGHDTTSSAISWLFYTLASHPDHQRLCHQELQTLMAGRESQCLTWDDLSDLPYLTMCIKESLRMHTPVPFVGREVKNPLTFPGIGTVPADAVVYVNTWALHHNPHVWGEDHLEYKPDRFSPENVQGRDPHAFLPFSAGPRNCIGQTFAMHEIKALAAQTLLRYELLVDDTHHVEHIPEVVMRSNGLKLFFEPRSSP